MTTVENPCEKSFQNKLLKIGELASQADVAVGTLRFYETLGLLEPTHRNANGYRYYDLEAVKQVQFIKKAQSLRFSLSEIQQVLGVRYQGNPACPLVRNLLNQKIADIEEEIYRMTALKEELEAYRNRWADKPLDEPCGKEVCSLIEEVVGHVLPDD